MKQIPLTQGKFALVDDSDFEFLSKITWYAKKDDGTGTFYAATNGIVNGKPATILMHRMMFGFPVLEIDHADTDGLNNQRSNLRKATKVQNQQNQKKPLPPKSSKFKGVCRTKHAWTASIGSNGKALYLGSFRTEDDAARAYNAAAIRKFGEFARLNKVDK